MLKALLVALLFVSSTFAEDSFLPPHRPWEKEEFAAANIGFGLARILHGHYQEALEDFEAAEKLSPESDVRFPLLFGKIIVYDCLNLRPECERSIGSLMLLMASYKQHDIDFEFEEITLVEDFLKTCARRAPSKDVRDFLLEIFE